MKIFFSYYRVVVIFRSTPLPFRGLQCCGIQEEQLTEDFIRYITEYYVEVSSQQEGYWLRKMKKVIF